MVPSFITSSVKSFCSASTRPYLTLHDFMQRRIYNICECRRSFSATILPLFKFLIWKMSLSWNGIHTYRRLLIENSWSFTARKKASMNFGWNKRFWLSYDLKTSMGLKCRKILIYVFGDLFKYRLMLVFLVNQPDWGSLLPSMWTETQIFFLTSDKNFNSLDIATISPVLLCHSFFSSEKEKTSVLKWIQFRSTQRKSISLTTRLNVMKLGSLTNIKLC